MNNAVKITLKKELRGILRDKKSLLMMLLTPLMIPGFIFLFGFVYDGIINEDNKETTVYNFGINYVPDEIESSITKDIPIKLETYDNKEKLDEAYKDNKIVGYAIKEESKYTIYANSLNSEGSAASAIYIELLEAYNKALATNYLINNNIDLDKVYNNVTYENKELKASKNELVDTLMNLGFVFAIMSISLSAIYTSTDATATEKERGTLETILTFPIKTKDLI